jgi:hypothetical protein
MRITDQTTFLNAFQYTGPRNHQYSLEVEYHPHDMDVPRFSSACMDLRVNARNSAQARKLAEKAGFIVRSVNMIG